MMVRCLIAVALVTLLGCGGAVKCDDTRFVVVAHPSGAPRPAGRVVVSCDGAQLMAIDASRVSW